MKKIVKILTLALCLPFAAATFSSCGGDDAIDDDDITPEVPAVPTSGVYVTYQGVNPNPDQNSFEFDAVKHEYSGSIVSETSHYNANGRTLVVKNYGTSPADITVTLEAVEAIPTSMFVNWCGITTSCEPYVGSAMTRSCTLGAGEETELMIDATFTEGTPAECKFKLTVNDGFTPRTYFVEFDYD